MIKFYNISLLCSECPNCCVYLFCYMLISILQPTTIYKRQYNIQHPEPRASTETWL